jgi:glycine cleavage system transcriptional repressor
MNKIIINAFGDDKPGLVFKITNVIKKYNGNIEISKIIQLESDFTLLMLVEISLKNTKKLFSELDEITDLKINYKITPKKNADNTCSEYLFTINVADNEGIIYLYSNLFKEFNINILKMESYVKNAANTGYPIFILNSVLTVPNKIDLQKLKSKLIKISETNNIDFDFELK